MTNLKYLKENNLYEAHVKFMQTLGEGFGFAPNGPIEEADDDENNGNQPPSNDQDPMGGGAPGGDPMGGGAPGGDPMGGGAPGGDPMGGGMPGGDPMGGGQDPMGGGAPGGDPMGGGAPGGDPMGGGQDPMGGGAPGGDPIGGGPMDEPPMEEEDDVIDVDDITNAQEKMNKTVNNVGRDLGKVDARIEKLLGAVDKLATMFDKNNQEIEQLKAEFERRNPTQTEKLKLRSLTSFPFNLQLPDYWSEKGVNSNYSADADNEEQTKDFVVTNDDVDDMSERDISDSFFVADDLNQNLKKIFGMV